MVAMFPDIPATSSWEQIFVQAALYGYILSIGADMIGDGAELLMLCPSIAPLVGSIVVPILGAVPDGMMVLCSGLGDDAQNQISVGVGALAGSTVMLLTLPWFLAINCGRVSIDSKGMPTYKVPSDQKLQNKGTVDALFNSGVWVHDQVKDNAKLMIKTTLPFWLIQIPAFMYDDKAIPLVDQRDAERPFALGGAVLCITFFTYYMVKMFRASQEEGSDVQVAIVKKTVEGIQTGQMTLRGAMHEFREATKSELEAGGKGQSLLSSSSAKAEETVKHMCRVLEPFFKNYDQNNDNQINIYEFRLLMQDLRENVSEDKTNAIFSAADMDKSGGINFEEFVACIMAFALDPFQPKQDEGKGALVNVGNVDDVEQAAGGEDGEEEEDMPPDLADLSPAEQQTAIKKRACKDMFFGSALVLLFSDPMVDLLGTMGEKADIPAFYISFLIAPLASNASELVSAMKLASKKTQNSMKESLSTLCGAAIMNNTFCLSIFFLCFVMKDLVWQFSAETISIVLIQYLVGIIAITKNVHTLGDGCLILTLYPAALLIVWGLKTYAGMD